MSAHRAARGPRQCASHSAWAGDAAASAYLHPLARATQVGHILRVPAHAALALRKKAGGSVDHRGSLVGIAAGWRRTLAVLADGTVRAAGREREHACAVESWTGVMPSQRETDMASASDPMGPSWRSATTSVVNARSLVGAPYGPSRLATFTLSESPLAAVSSWLAIGRPHQPSLPAWRGMVSIAAGSRHTVAMDDEGNGIRRRRQHVWTMRCGRLAQHRGCFRSLTHLHREAPGFSF